MQKILIWDHAGDSARWCKNYLEQRDVEIVQTITPAEPAPEILLKSDAYDWLLIFERKMRPVIDTTIETLKLPLEKVIYAFDVQSWLQKPKALYTLLNDSGGGVSRRWYTFNSCRKQNDFVTCTVDGVSYVATAKDNTIMRSMFVHRVNWAADSMKRFHELSKQYYNIEDDSAGYFLDLGANIGTTGIYFCKKFAPNLNFIAFEPDSENFKMLKINTTLNDMQSKATLVNRGLGMKSEELVLYKNLENPGGNSVLNAYSKRKSTETIKIIPLDSYFAENKISPSEVKYIWIDTEGFEAQVMLGAKNLISQNPAPIFVECNLCLWDESGHFEELMALLEANYTHFILFRGREEIVYPIETLRTMERPTNYMKRIGDIFIYKTK